MNRKTLDFPHPSSCSNFPNSNVIVDTMTPPNVGLKRASYQIFRRSGFREICVGVRTRQVVSIPRDDKGNCQRVFLTAKNHDPPANKDRIAALLGRKFLDFLLRAFGGRNHRGFWMCALTACFSSASDSVQKTKSHKIRFVFRRFQTQPP